MIQNLLRPGDVILTMGGEKFSKGIAWATRSGFSHAIQVVSPTRSFEADDEGVGYSEPLTTGAWYDGPAIHQWVIPLPDCTDARVLRHPTLATCDPRTLEVAINTIVAPWAGEDYSDYRRLMYPLDIGGRPKWWMRLSLTYYQWRDRRRSSGMFCSEVIARVFEALERDHGFADASLFITRRHADLVSPGLLAESRLQAVEGAVLFRDRLPPGHRIGDGLYTDRRTPTSLARSKKRIAEMMAAFKASVARKTAEATRAAEVANARLERFLSDSIRAAEELGTPRTLARLLELRDEMTALSREAEEQEHAATVAVEQTLRHQRAWIELEFTVRQARADGAEEALQVHPDVLDATEVRQSLTVERAAIEADRERARHAFDALRQKHALSPEDEAKPTKN